MMLDYALCSVAQFSPLPVQAGGGMQRIEEILAETPASTDHPGAAELPRLSAAIGLAQVAFGYAGRNATLHGDDLCMPCGALVGIVGGSDSGNGTVVDLPLRFHDSGAGPRAVPRSGRGMSGGSRGDGRRGAKAARRAGLRHPRKTP